MCAWGFFNKIKKGLKKAMTFVKDKVVKPLVSVAKKAGPIAGLVADTIAPGSGALLRGGIDAADKFVNGDYSQIADALRSGKIRLK